MNILVLSILALAGWFTALVYATLYCRVVSHVRLSHKNKKRIWLMIKRGL